MSVIEGILKALPFERDELALLISTAPFRYKVYQIPKRQPNQYRTIAQPTPEIKLIQQWLVAHAFSKLPVHRSATAYRPGMGIADHAKRHAKHRFLLKMDFKEFFPSISSDDIRTYLSESARFSDPEIAAICRLVCWRNKRTGHLCLSIGAPSSPFLSNAILFQFDSVLSDWCKAMKIAYSRYADDLAFSTSQKQILEKVPEKVEAICAELRYPRLVLNDSKTVSTSRAYRRTLVGLVLASDGNVSLGRERKRRLRSELHHYFQGTLPAECVGRLRGELAFAWSVEPKFIQSLVAHFGGSVFDQLELPFATPKYMPKKNS